MKTPPFTPSIARTDMPLTLDDDARATLLIHYYRAMVGRADIWRVRMDTTTNWSIGTTAAVLSFALGDASSPHFVVHIAAFLTVIFLLLEARRLTFYQLWQGRVLLLERTLLRSAIAPESPGDRNGPEASMTLSTDELERELVPQLGTTIPSMSLCKAAARRLRRVYVYLFAAQLLGWILKLSSHPVHVTSASELVSRAAVGPVPGAVILGFSVAGLVIAVGLAVARGATSRKEHKT